ncbi:type IV pilus secretin family protein [Candidatus Nitrotoga sp. 1052]|uniref:type IV pilus secretin family protein n=1 Tax=Candidatus Nitrotoga sp. 1052 TaxID=2886964 RepID=UPI001EF60022|nr:type IV pilus secretin family protein [Candidatus Nitrotoga sp. 1052]CAH1089900.1 Type IV pilus biogenesis and competence protein PilQ [Candidatus Nitrotoga sp. 1052]
MRHYKNAIKNLVLLVVAVFAVCAVTAHAQGNTNAQNASTQNPDAENSIQSLSVSAAPGGKLVLKMGLKNALANPPLNFAISNPARIVFDFPNTTNGLGKSTQKFGIGELRSANIVQSGNRTRLVVNLNQILVYDAHTQGTNLLITLHGKIPAVSAAVATARFAEAKSGTQKYSLRDIVFRRGGNGEGRIQVDLSDPGVGIGVKQQGKSLIVDFMNTSLPRNLQRKLDVVDFGTPIQGIDTFMQGDHVRMVIEPKGLWEHVAYQTDNKFIVEIKAVADDPNKLLKNRQVGYAGEKLTLSFQNIAVREALNVIADFTNLNMVISDSVSGNLTLRLKDVPWDQALQIILDSRGLDMRKNGNVIQVAPREELATKEKINLSANQEISDLEILHTESFQIAYSKGAEIIALLQSPTQRMLSKRGSAVVDARTNTVFVQDTPSRLEEVRKLIKQVDVAVRQVMIEARFVEASDKFTRTLGGRLSYTGPPPSSGGGFSVGGGRGSIGGSAGGGEINLPGTPGLIGTGVVTAMLFNSSVTKILGLELQASQLNGITNNIASPRVVTANGTEAVIEQGVQIPYQTVSLQGTNVLFKKAILSLTVTPQITPDDNINMKVEVTQDSVGEIINSTVGGIPSINTKKISTQVLIDNGGTVVIGGVYTQDELRTTPKVPLLGDIPILGWLFKTQTDTNNKRELLVFISPKILSDSLNLR